MNKPASVTVDKFFWKGVQSAWCEKLRCTGDVSSAGGTVRKVERSEHMKERCAELH